MTLWSQSEITGAGSLIWDVMRPPERHFPKAEPDGSFVVRVSFESPPGEPIETVRDWLIAWMNDQSDGHALGEIGSSRPFAAYFTAPPHADLGSGAS